MVVLRKKSEYRSQASLLSLTSSSASLSSSCAADKHGNDIEVGGSNHYQPPLHSLFGRWSSAIMMLPSNTKIIDYSDGDLPKTIQLYYPPTRIEQHQQRQRTNAKQPTTTSSLPLMALLTLLTILLLTLITWQQTAISTLQNELQITNSHRTYMIQTESNLLRQLQEREGSIQQNKISQERLTKLNIDLKEMVERLRVERDELKMEVERLRR